MTFAHRVSSSLNPEKNGLFLMAFILYICAEFRRKFLQ